MRDWEALNKELEQSGRAGELKKLANSADGQKLGKMLDEDAVRSAVKNGDTAGLQEMLRGVLSTGEGQRLAAQIRQLMGK